MLLNQQIAELLAREAEQTTFPAQRALRRAARRAYIWEHEATDLIREKRSLTELSGVGPFIEKLIKGWIARPPRDTKSPPIRAGFLTWVQSRAVLQKNPRWPIGIKGDLQVHTNWSDGSGSIAEMVEAARQLNYEYLAITDHAKGLKIAGGIDEAQVRKQAAEIASVNGTNGRPAALRSIELNLNPEGKGDLSSSCLRKLDLVLGCFHSSLRKTEDQTKRYIAALNNPDIQILGHPRGRIYNHRVGLQADWKQVFESAAELGKAVEIDGYPDRQDLSLDLVKTAFASGCRISLSTDSHGPSQLRFMDYSAASALMAGIGSERILNLMTKDKLLGWVDDVRRNLRTAASV